LCVVFYFFFFFQAEDGIRDRNVTGVQTCALPIFALPFVNQLVALMMLGIIGLLLMLSFSVTVVYAQELVPGKIGTMSGLIVGLSFGLGAIGAVTLGLLIDYIGL